EEPAGPAPIPAQPVDADQHPERPAVAADLLDAAVQPGARQSGHEQYAGPHPAPLPTGEEVGQPKGAAAPGGHGADDLLDGLGGGAANLSIAVGGEEEVVPQRAALHQGAGDAGGRLVAGAGHEVGERPRRGGDGPLGGADQELPGAG